MSCSRRTAETRFSRLVGHTIQDEIRNVRMAKAKTGLSMRAWRTQNGIKAR